MTPIVLHHGLFGFEPISIGPLHLSYFRGIDRAITDRGHPLLVSGVHPTASIATRARQLKEKIIAQFGLHGPKMIIIAHSMGGLDARYLISKLGMSDRVAALVTICTPHRGSPYADWAIQNVGNRLGGLKLMDMLGLDVEAFADLTTTRCAIFNQEVLDAPGVSYFSISAARPWHKMPPWALPHYKLIQNIEGDNDGLVSVKSAAWGEHLGTWPADHWHAINHRFRPEFTDDKTGDIAPYYLRILDMLRGRGLIEGNSVGVDSPAASD